MRICVVNLTTKEIVDDVYESNLNKKKYCEKYNLDYRFYLGRASKRHAQWDKIQCVMQNLPEYDYIVWIDSDAIFNNFEVSIIDLIKNNQRYDALFCSDVCYSEGQNHLLINTGVMIFKNSEWSFDILDKVWKSIGEYSIENLNKHSYDGFPHEQGKLCEILLREDETKYKIFSSNVFNQHPNSSNENTFIIHFMGSRQTQNHIETFKNAVRISNKKLNIDYQLKENINYIKLRKLDMCVVSSYTDNISSVADITSPNKKDYCKKHAYDLVINKGRLSLRHPGWDKIKLILNQMDTNTCDYFVWIDNDAYITNKNLRFDFICNNYSSKNFIICSEQEFDKQQLDDTIDFNNLQNLRLINTGVFIVKNNEWGRKFLEDIWNTKSNTNQGINCSHAEIHTNSFTYDFWPFEQGPLHIVLSQRQPSEYIVLKNYIMNIFKHQHKKYHFVCHFVGTHNNAQGILDYISSLKEIDVSEKILIQDDKKHTVYCKGKECYLTYKIYQDNNDTDKFILKYIWDFSNINEENLSHCFRINNSKEISFGSEKFGNIVYKKDDTIEHSYDWFGEKEWIKIITC